MQEFVFLNENKYLKKFLCDQYLFGSFTLCEAYVWIAVRAGFGRDSLLPYPLAISLKSGCSASLGCGVIFLFHA